MQTVFYIFLLILSFAFMELVAWFTHKYIMHGFLWVLHKDHHIRDGRKLEWNDLFAVIFALPSIIFIIAGISRNFNYSFFIGLGIALYGLAYFLFHDIYVHKRLNLFGNMQIFYLEIAKKAHQTHHVPGSYKNYGFLFPPLDYFNKKTFNKS